MTTALPRSLVPRSGLLPRSGVWAVARMAARQALVDRPQLIAKIVFYGILLLVFSQLWGVVLGAELLDSGDAANYVWYLALTEWVVISVPQVHLAIESELRDGGVAYRMARPMSYLCAQAAETIGDVAVRLAVLGSAGVVLAGALTGQPPSSAFGLLLALPLGLLAVLGLIGMQLAIGFLAFWLRDASPVFWIVQKGMFVLGGLMLPLDVYPEWLRTISDWTPFSAWIYGVGRMALDPSIDVFCSTLCRLVLWGAVLWGLAWEVHRRALRAIRRHGD